MSIEWVLLSYQLPREPSTRRVAVWRKLRLLGVAQLGDGLVALPADARTQEQLEWLAEEAVEAGGRGVVWLARTSSAAEETRIIADLMAARTAEYEELMTRVRAAADLDEGAERQRAVARLRAEARAITRRDYFPPPAREATLSALADLASTADRKSAPSRRPS